MAKIRHNVISISREPMLGKDRYGGASHKRRVREDLLQVCRCRKQLLPFRQIAFGHKSSKSDSAERMDQTGEAWRPEGSALESPSVSRQRREAFSTHQADREQLRRLLPQVSTQNDSDGGATSSGL
jgi:hypothetical protein